MFHVSVFTEKSLSRLVLVRLTFTFVFNDNALNRYSCRGLFRTLLDIYEWAPS